MVPPQDRQPTRTCVGCRRRDQQQNLVRFVVATGTVVIDEASRQPGRGAYLHRKPECWESASKRGHVARALRAQGQLDTSVLDAYPAKLSLLTDVREL